MLLDNLMPVYDFKEVHALTVRAVPHKVFRAIKEVTPREVPVFRILLGRRGGQPLIDQMLQVGFVLLGEETNREFVLGTIGQFWKLWRTTPALITRPQEFSAFEDPCYAKAAMNFHLNVSHSHGGTIVSTETRIRATDPVARKKFAAYWRLIGLGSAISRRLLLKAIRLRAEQSAHLFSITGWQEG